MNHIYLEDVSLTFKLRHVRRTSLKDYFVSKLYKTRNNPMQTVEALSNLSFKLNEGNRLGVIGHNGAGKSTLLRMLAGIYPPSSGKMHIQGKIQSLLDIGLGIEPFATGRQNIMYRGYVQGETPKTLCNKVEEIADFCELGEFLDLPVRFYSSGMYVRLLFSIATAIDPDILLIDEVLGAGDLSFQEKAKRRILSLIGKARVVVFATHDLKGVQEICDRVAWMDHGHMRMIGHPAEVVEAYRNSVEQMPALPAAA